jgi:hypothetical protein
MADDSTNSTHGGLGDAIRDNATGPAKVTADGIIVEQHRPTDVIAAEKYELAKAAMRTRNFGLRRARIIPSGATEGF